MKLWAVFQEGVYRHSCGGIYDSEERAVAAADRIAADDYDDYHIYEVVPFTLNQDDEGRYVYQVKRSEALKKLGPHEGDCLVSKDYSATKGKCSHGTKACIRDKSTVAAVPRQSDGAGGNDG